MKQTWKWAMLAFVAAIALGFSSCSDDDDEKDGGDVSQAPRELFGQWLEYHGENECGSNLIELNSNGRFVWYEGDSDYEDNKTSLSKGYYYDRLPGSWSFNKEAQTITFMYDDDEDEMEVYVVKSLSDGHLALSEIFDESEGYNSHWNFKKVSLKMKPDPDEDWDDDDDK